MSDKLFVVGGDCVETKKLLLKLLTAETENAQNIPSDNDAFVCIADGQADVREQLKALGYKTVTIAYSDELISRTIGNSDLEKHGYKFEDGV